MTDNNEMMIYIHIPFCVRKCLYCDFCSFPADREMMDKYVEALKDEIREQSESIIKKPVTSVFIGGGTPTVLKGTDIAGTLQTCRDCFDVAEDAEITVEENPGTVNSEKLAALKEAGVNRLSIGMQSENIRTLETLGRIHTFEDTVAAYDAARKAGFTNINLDLISAIPGESAEEYLHSVEAAAKLGPEHISAYSLIIEEGTPFYDMYKDGSGLPDEETERYMYRKTGELLSGYGYHRYEISNYAKSGFECRHNSGYWTLKDYAGFGLSAAGLVNTEDGRFRTLNTRSFKDYLLSPRDSRASVPETEKDETEEFMFLGLRMDRGIDTDDFKQRFGRDINDVYGSIIKKHLAEELLIKEGSMLRLTERGMDISNSVLCDYLL